MARLLNASGRELFVEVDGERIALPQVTPPVFMNKTTEVSERTFELEGKTFSLPVGTSQPSSVLFLPPEDPDVTYVVEPETLARLPHRSDLVTPAWFGSPKSDTQSPKRFASVLVGVSEKLQPTSPDTEFISDFVIYEEDDLVEEDIK